jgi:hypothetical protein
LKEEEKERGEEWNYESRKETQPNAYDKQTNKQDNHSFRDF